MKTKKDYYSLLDEIDLIAQKHGMHYELTDACVDMQNVLDGTGVKETDEDFWSRMYASACSSAGMRAEDRGLDLNKLIGRIIY